jgi:hypothetical protein
MRARTPPPSVDGATRLLGVRFSRRAEGTVVFEVRRPDGTATWQKRTGPTAEFFAVHDLTHFAVESELGLRRAFYGLVAEGWELSDFGTPWPRGPMPPDALPAEFIVGCFDTARATGTPLTASDCNRAAETYFAAAGLPAPAPLTDVSLGRIRDRIADLVRRWHSVPPGGSLELTFAPTTPLPPEP